MSEIRVDTISEKTSANGVAIDSVTLKDGGATLTDNITFSASGKGVHLGVTSATASNLLDDYEEGTFNGAFRGSSGSPSGVNYSHRENHYTKIGDTVYFSGYLQSSSWSSGPSGHLLFSGLPFLLFEKAKPGCFVPIKPLSPSCNISFPTSSSIFISTSI